MEFSCTLDPAVAKNTKIRHFLRDDRKRRREDNWRRSSWSANPSLCFDVPEDSADQRSKKNHLAHRNAPGASIIQIDVPPLLLQAARRCRADMHTTVGGSLSVLIGLTPEFDSDCSHQCKQLVTRIARLEVVVRRAGASIDLQPTETTKEVEKTDSRMAISVNTGRIGPRV